MLGMSGILHAPGSSYWLPLALLLLLLLLLPFRIPWDSIGLLATQKRCR